jgi:VWFA-related protein
MRLFWTVPVIALFAAVFALTPGDAVGRDEPSPADYEIVVENVLPVFRERAGRRALFVTVQFKIQQQGKAVTDVPAEQIVVEEDGRRVTDLEIFQPRARDLTTVLAIDVSGSMREHGKMNEAKQAAQTFLDRLDPKSDSGLILFDHELRLQEPPARDKARYAAHRAELRRHIDGASPGGGTAYLDAVSEAVRMLKGASGRRAVVVLTDGVDLSSQRTLEQVIAEAKAAEVPVYTLGIGEPGKNESVTTILVLDHSGSMRAKANDADRGSKMQALHVAASRFVDLMRPGAKTTLLPFSSRVETPGPFTTDKVDLKKKIQDLRPAGGTLLYDATYAGIETLVAGRPPGKKAVVVLTDGKDESPGSRHSAEEVIARAKEAGVPLHLLGLGRRREINEPIMRKMAQETGGTYHHAETQQKLFEIFENLSIELHDDGIDEASLKRLAAETGGSYHPARNVSELQLIYSRLADELQTTYVVTFPSQRSSHDGTARGIDVSLWRGGTRISQGGSVDYNVRGVVVPEMDHAVYLGFLAVLALLLALPAGLRGLYRFYGGQ